MILPCQKKENLLLKMIFCNERNERHDSHVLLRKSNYSSALILHRSMPNPTISILPLINTIFLEGNPFSCDCALRPFVHYIQARKQEQNISARYDFQVICMLFFYT